jgi:isopenicillin-N N-acyltransferase-like protein
MIPEHVSTHADPYRRGVAFGRALKGSVRDSVLAYERLFEAVHCIAPSAMASIGTRIGERLAAAQPAAVAEIEGIARGAGVDFGQVMAINARTEIFAGAGPPECSVIGVGAERSGEGVLLAQNWDWHPDAAQSLVLWTVPTSSGGWLTTLTEAGMLAKIGLNSDGLAVCINLLSSSDDSREPRGAPIHVMLRALLERCSDMAQAEALLLGNAWSASTAITTAFAGEPDGLRTFEVSPAGVNAISARRGVLVHTNHFLGPTGDAVDVTRCDWPDTVARLAELEKLADCAEPIGAEAVKSSLRSHAAGRIAVCCHDPGNPRYAHRQETLASIVIHVGGGYLEVADGPPCTAPYARVRSSSWA